MGYRLRLALVLDRVLAETSRALSSDSAIEQRRALVVLRDQATLAGMLLEHETEATTRTETTTRT